MILEYLPSLTKAGVAYFPSTSTTTPDSVFKIDDDVTTLSRVASDVRKTVVLIVVSFKEVSPGEISFVPMLFN
jgi:hypothetical protein